MYITPQLDILPAAQKKIWPALAEVPSCFVLYGGTAIALRFAHRESVDFDFFTSDRNIELTAVVEQLSFLKIYESSMPQLRANQINLDVKVDDTIVHMTFLNNLELTAGAVSPPDKATDNHVNIASPLDLMASKILAIHGRTSGKDYVDLATLIEKKYSLQEGLEAAMAVARLTPDGERRLELEPFLTELRGEEIVNHIMNVRGLATYESAKKYAEIIKEAATAVKLDQVFATRMIAFPDLVNVPQNRSEK